MVHKALGLMEMGPREATQGELQGELRLQNYKGLILSKFVKKSIISHFVDITSSIM